MTDLLDVLDFLPAQHLEALDADIDAGLPGAKTKHEILVVIRVHRRASAAVPLWRGGGSLKRGA